MKFRTKSGITDKSNEKSYFIEIRSWGEPRYSDSLNYKSIIRKFQKDIKSFVYNEISTENFYKDKIIVDLNMRSSGIRYGKKSFMSCSIFLQKKDKNYLIEDKKLINSLLNEVITKNKHLKF